MGTDPGQTIFATHPRETLLHMCFRCRTEGGFLPSMMLGKKASPKKGSNTLSSGVDKADLVNSEQGGQEQTDLLYISIISSVTIVGLYLVLTKYFSHNSSQQMNTIS